MKLKLHVWDNGDSSVGITGTDSIVTIEDNYKEDPEDIEYIKEFLREYYDNNNINIMTEAEYIQYLKDEAAAFGGGESE